jgi:hypothetical protein
MSGLSYDVWDCLAEPTAAVRKLIPARMRPDATFVPGGLFRRSRRQVPDSRTTWCSIVVRGTEYPTPYFSANQDMQPAKWGDCPSELMGAASVALAAKCGSFSGDPSCRVPTFNEAMQIPTFECFCGFELPAAYRVTNTYPKQPRADDGIEPKKSGQLSTWEGAGIKIPGVMT